MIKNRPAQIRNKKLNGFTLIELLVIIAIIAILMGVGYANMSGISRQKQVKKAALQIKAGLIEASQNAFYGKKPNDACTLTGYTFETSQSGSDYQYEIIPDCINTAGDDPAFKQANIESGVSVTETSVRFPVGAEQNGIDASFVVTGAGTSITIEVLNGVVKIL
jgi:prepilin-type N-terminal cleavage/methylation domain-containing protein